MSLTHSLNYQSIQPEQVAALKDRGPEKMSQRRKGAGWWGEVGLLLQALSPWMVIAGPPSTLHYASALRQMEWSRIQLRKNKQVGSARLRHGIVSITAQAKLSCNCNVIWKTYFLSLSMKGSTGHFRHTYMRLKAKLTLMKYSKKY